MSRETDEAARYEGINRVIAAIVCVAVLLAFLSGSVTYGRDARDISHAGCASSIHESTEQDIDLSSPDFDLADVPEYWGDPSAVVHDDEPFFTDEDRVAWASVLAAAQVAAAAAEDGAQDGEPYVNVYDSALERYSDLDRRGRCGTAFALVGRETMPTAKREGIGMVRPSGWQIARYPWVDGEYLFNRCHLIGFQLTGENANAKNLITGTRSMNIYGMLPYEDDVAYYVRWSGNHVLYRVTPVFEGHNLVASGVLIEAESFEDEGEDLSFCVWCYNVEPGVEIDYANGDNRSDGTME